MAIQEFRVIVLQDTLAFQALMEQTAILVTQECRDTLALAAIQAFPENLDTPG